MFGIGGMEMLVIGVIALLIFGPKRLPELARSLGKGLAEFRRASSDLRRSIDFDHDEKRTSARDPEHEPPAQAGSPGATEPQKQVAGGTHGSPVRTARPAETAGPASTGGPAPSVPKSG